MVNLSHTIVTQYNSSMLLAVRAWLHILSIPMQWLLTCSSTIWREGGREGEGGGREGSLDHRLQNDHLIDWYHGDNDNIGMMTDAFEYFVSKINCQPPRPNAGLHICGEHASHVNDPQNARRHFLSGFLAATLLKCICFLLHLRFPKLNHKLVQIH